MFMIFCPEDSNNLFNDAQREHASATSLRKLYLAIGICSLFMTIEFIGGYFANSLAIISDAVHLLSGIKTLIFGEFILKNLTNK